MFLIVGCAICDCAALYVCCIYTVVPDSHTNHHCAAGCLYVQAMENSIAVDYVTEKVYDALAVGCIPIYLGAPNIGDFVPAHAAIIDYRTLGSPEQLAAELERLANNQTAYEEKLAWKTQLEKWNKGKAFAWSMCTFLATVPGTRNTACLKSATTATDVIQRDAGILYLLLLLLL